MWSCAGASRVGLRRTSEKDSTVMKAWKQGVTSAAQRGSARPRRGATLVALPSEVASMGMLAGGVAISRQTAGAAAAQPGRVR